MATFLESRLLVMVKQEIGYKNQADSCRHCHYRKEVEMGVHACHKFEDLGIFQTSEGASCRMFTPDGSVPKAED